ncbi:hypothetical protein QQF64_032054 [Cirrhinus molitorella]|uniref:Uncharacterized protein n=1 Tax=Cirrhinus molitorella TaxID=172907 RepID=A0ABR3MYQ9_9TELE
MPRPIIWALDVSGSPSDGRGGRDVIKGAPTSFAKEKLVDPQWKRDTGSRTNAVCLERTLSWRFLPVTLSRGMHEEHDT